VALSCELSGCTPGCVGVGRRPEGLIEPPASRGGGLGAWLAEAAHLEAASVPAFARLERELAAHGAPERLLAGARRARLDEVRHALQMTDFARASGARVARVEVPALQVRSLEEMALENAVEGCVRETLGAHAAWRRSQVVRDPQLAAALVAIARDERRHGNLAWAVDAWSRPRLDPAARRRVEAARRLALREASQAA
jgi:hypothetical protein